MSDATFADPDLTTFARLEGLGLQVIGQHFSPDRAAVACRVVEPDDWCHRCGCQGVARDTVTRELGHWSTLLVAGTERVLVVGTRREPG
jgi:hypothetical protein